MTILKQQKPVQDLVVSKKRSSPRKSKEQSSEMLLERYHQILGPASALR